MLKLTSRLLLLAAGCCTPLAFADAPSVSILSPLDGAQLDPKVRTRVYYEYTPGPKGEHAHLYLDNKQVAELRRIKDSYTLNPLALGEHEICIKVVSKGHKPTGVQQCNKVSVEKQAVKFEDAPKMIHTH